MRIKTDEQIRKIADNIEIFTINDIEYHVLSTDGEGFDVAYLDYDGHPVTDYMSYITMIGEDVEFFGRYNLLEDTSGQSCQMTLLDGQIGEVFLNEEIVIRASKNSEDEHYDITVHSLINKDEFDNYDEVESIILDKEQYK